MESENEISGKRSLTKRLIVGFAAVAALGIPAAYEAHAIASGLAESAPSASGMTANNAAAAAHVQLTGAHISQIPETPYLPPRPPHYPPRYYR